MPSDPSRPVTVSQQMLPARRSEREIVRTLFDLGRRVTSVLDLDELLERLPSLIQRLIVFDAFAVYLLDERRSRLEIAHSVGYPDRDPSERRFGTGVGLVGVAVTESRPILINDVTVDPRYHEMVPGMRSELAVPLRHKSRVIGAINVLSARPGQFDGTDLAILRQFGVHVAVAIVNARLFERERRASEAFETLAEIGHEVSSILDLDDVLTRIAQLVRRVIDYRTFGIFLLDEQRRALDVKVAVKYGATVDVPSIPLGHGLVGFAALHEESVLVPDVSADPRYIPVVEDVRSELAVPMMVKDRCIGVLDLESPEFDAFDSQDAEILALLASQAAVAIENARLYQAVAANERRLDREVRFAQRVQMALMPAEPPRSPHFDVAGRLESARELGGDFHDFISPSPKSLMVAVGDVSGKGVAAALYGAYAGELVRSRTFRRRFDPERFTPAGILASMNAKLHERQLEEYYCTLCYAAFDLAQRTVTLSNSGLPYPLRVSGGTAEFVHLPGLPLGSFPNSTYDELTLDVRAGDLWLFCSDGVHDATDERDREFSKERLGEVARGVVDRSAAEVVDAVFAAVRAFRGDSPVTDDVTVLAVRVTGE